MPDYRDGRVKQKPDSQKRHSPSWSSPHPVTLVSGEQRGAPSLLTVLPVLTTPSGVIYLHASLGICHGVSKVHLDMGMWRGSFLPDAPMVELQL